MATLPEIVNWLEGGDALHLGRILILVDAFAGRRGDQTIDGIRGLNSGALTRVLRPKNKNGRVFRPSRSKLSTAKT